MRSSAGVSPPTKIVHIGSTSVIAEVADTPALIERGLSGRGSLQDGQGMLFVFSAENRWGFWMKDKGGPPGRRSKIAPGRSMSTCDRARGDANGRQVVKVVRAILAERTQRVKAQRPTSRTGRAIASGSGLQLLCCANRSAVGRIRPRRNKEIPRWREKPPRCWPNSPPR
jgi:hypothetical protein